jgi:acetoacetate decarboxylase
MVLKGREGYTIPFDASLYGSTISPSTPAREVKIEYRNCEALLAVFTIANDVDGIIPEGVKPIRPLTGAIWMSRYSFSTLGEYNEFISLIQVRDAKGKMASYIPYIYVTNDAAMAAGRELAGAPKKLAKIELRKDLDLIQGTLERPSGKRLSTLTFKPEGRARGGVIDAVLPRHTPLLSVRHLPPINGGDGLTQLVRWYAEIYFHRDPEGERAIWMGPISITYDSPSMIDPVHKIEIGNILGGFYFQFDMVLGVEEVQLNYV